MLSSNIRNDPSLRLRVEDGGVRDVKGLAPNILITVVDYDIEEEDRQSLTASPIDGELCKLIKL
jgi:hypothetical protein